MTKLLDYLGNLRGMGRLAFATALVLAFVSGFGPVRPAAAQGMPDKQLIEKGREVFLTAGGVGCAACHGRYAEGDVGIGPNNRGMNEAKIRAALASVLPMKILREELSDAEIKEVAAYVEWLGQLKLVKTLVKRGHFVPERIEIYPGTRIQLVVNNASIEPHKFASDAMKIEPVTVEGRQSMDVMWEAPQTEGTFTLACADCGIKDQLTIEVTNKAKKFIPAEAVTTALAKAPPASQPTPQPQPTPQQADAQTIEKGRQIFLGAGDVGCVACHGPYAEGDVGIGPYNRGFSEAAIRKALKSVRPMAFLRQALSEEQIKQVAAYYQSLAHEQLVKTHVVLGLFIPEKVSVHPGTTIQLVIINRSLAPRTFTSPNMGVKNLTVAGRDASDFLWKAPEHEGTFDLVCTDCPIKGQKLTITVSNAVPPYTPPVTLK